MLVQTLEQEVVFVEFSLAVVVAAVQDVEMEVQVAAVIEPVVEEHLIQEQLILVAAVELAQEVQDLQEEQVVTVDQELLS